MKPQFNFMMEAIDFDDLMSLDLTGVDMQDLFLEVLRLALDNYQVCYFIFILFYFILFYFFLLMLWIRSFILCNSFFYLFRFSFAVEFLLTSQLNLEEIDEQELTIAQYSCLLGWNTVLKALVNEFNINLDAMQAALSDYSVLGGFEDNIAYLLQYRNRMHSIAHRFVDCYVFF
jgi:hypothetical protein